MHTVAGKIAAHQGYLDKIKAGSTGTAAVNLYDGTTLLVSLPIDHAASSVSGTTGQLTLVPGAAGVGVAEGTGDNAAVVARDETVLEEAVEVAAGTSAVSGKAVFSSLNIIVGGAVTMTSATIG